MNDDDHRFRTFDGVSKLNAPWVAAWRSITWFLDRVEPTQRASLAISALQSTGALSVGAILISLDRSSREKEESKREALFDDEGLNTLTKTWLEMMRELARDSQALLKLPNLLSLLYRWRDFSGSIDEPRAWVQKVSADERHFAILVAAFMTVGTSHGMRDRVASRTETFQREVVEDFWDLKDIRQRLQRLEEIELSETTAHAIAVLRQQVTQWMRESSSEEAT